MKNWHVLAGVAGLVGVMWYVKSRDKDIGSPGTAYSGDTPDVGMDNPAVRTITDRIQQISPRLPIIGAEASNDPTHATRTTSFARAKEGGTLAPLDFGPMSTSYAVETVSPTPTKSAVREYTDAPAPAPTQQATSEPVTMTKLTSFKGLI